MLSRRIEDEMSYWLGPVFVKMVRLILNLAVSIHLFSCCYWRIKVVIVFAVKFRLVLVPILVWLLGWTVCWTHWAEALSLDSDFLHRLKRRFWKECNHASYSCVLTIQYLLQIETDADEISTFLEARNIDIEVSAQLCSIFQILHPLCQFSQFTCFV